MQDSNLSEPELLKTILQPLLEDFQYWFGRSRTLLETEQLDFLGAQEQSVLLERVKQAQEEVNTAKMLFNATQGQVGIDMATLMPWHQLLSECWKVAMQYRTQQASFQQQDGI
ncbi:DUF2605 domain-containing protein [Chlorogloeopsis sp. ULAP01]|uniref:DUF2605 domain-containing protein n=1 Tax=Chlorogloeopsis sp. ULAP01 TaxID=3056483 RepID=UPI0025AA617A|nr:DUF2605 domain-containing protein [Chlorogloeopsis sp. ULAP01]MDM9382515.1 DUF2605 domain-containing protein [Chlorogloeopsis sp. ULAP01]